MVEKLELVETCNRYDVAPLEGFHIKMGSVETFVAPFAGEANLGAEGAAAAMVVKLHAVE